jgi:regulator of RNase E activity RraB
MSDQTTMQDKAAAPYKDCPVCGGRPHYSSDQTGTRSISCDCGAYLMSRNELEMRDQWNVQDMDQAIERACDRIKFGGEAERQEQMATQRKEAMMVAHRLRNVKTRTEVFDALVRRLTELGEDQATVVERAVSMANGWFYFSDNSMDEHGHETCRDWMDAEIVRLLDLGLRYGVPTTDAA